jgi:hypothetical protein
LTFKFKVKPDDETAPIEQYNVFERRLADKLTYLDWKLSFNIDLEDFTFLHAKGS